MAVILSKKTICSWFSWAAIAALVALVPACDKPEEEEQKLANPNAAATNIGHVNSNFSPDSLELTSGPALNLSEPDFFSMQPLLLKAYLAMGKGMVTMAAEIVPHLSKFIANKNVGDSGEETLADAGDINKIEYTIFSETRYKATVYTDKGAFLHMAVEQTDDGNDRYELNLDFEQDPDREEGDKSFKGVATTITYSSETDFTVDVKLAGAECDPEEVQGPNYINVLITKNADQWQGKAMLYFPRWADFSRTTTCDTAITDELKLFMYHDFVATDDKATASLYMANGDLDSKDAFDTYGIQNFCTTYPGLCNDGKLGHSAVVADTYINPFCALADGTITWNGACEGLPVDGYSDKSLWSLPNDVQNTADDGNIGSVPGLADF